MLAEAIKGAAESVKDYVAGAVEMAAHTEGLQIGTEVLAKARGLDAKAARDQIEAIGQIGYTTENATETINRMLVAGQNLQRSQALAKVAIAAATDLRDLFAAAPRLEPYSALPSDKALFDPAALREGIAPVRQALDDPADLRREHLRQARN